MTTIESFVRNLTFDEKVTILTDYATFQKNGYMEGSLLREMAKELSTNVIGKMDSLYISILANEVAHNLANEYIISLRNL